MLYITVRYGAIDKDTSTVPYRTVPYHTVQYSYGHVRLFNNSLCGVRVSYIFETREKKSSCDRVNSQKLLRP